MTSGMTALQAAWVPHMFRVYGSRGLAPAAFDESVSQRLALAFVQWLRQPGRSHRRGRTSYRHPLAGPSYEAARVADVEVVGAHDDALVALEGRRPKLGETSPRAATATCPIAFREYQMRFPSWKRIVTLGLLAGLVSVVAACGEDAGEVNPYRVGVMESLTGAGETYGTVAHQAKTMAMDEINAAGGINGRMLELVVEDSKCSAQDAISAYNKLTDVDGVKIILGTTCSGTMLGVAPLAEADGVVLFSGLASNPDIANAGDYIFRTQISDIEVGIRTGNVLWADGIRALATITEETDYAEGVRRTSAAQFEKNGGRVIAEEHFASDVTDFRSQLTKLFNAGPDALHIAPQSEFAAGTIVKQARELGFQGPIYGETVTVGSTALEIAGDAATGIKAISAVPDPNNAKAQDVLADFAERYDYITLPWHLGSAYDTVYIAAECLKQTNDDQDADGFRDCLYNITWSGALGDNYSFDADGEVVGLSRVVVEVLPPAERTKENYGYRVLGRGQSE